jgi:hypothetical protein
MQLHAARGSGGMGPAGLAFSELVAWQTLTGVELNPWELEVIQALDRVALKAAADQNATPGKTA